MACWHNQSQEQLEKCQLSNRIKQRSEKKCQNKIWKRLWEWDLGWWKNIHFKYLKYIFKGFAKHFKYVFQGFAKHFKYFKYVYISRIYEIFQRGVAREGEENHERAPGFHFLKSIYQQSGAKSTRSLVSQIKLSAETQVFSFLN